MRPKNATALTSGAMPGLSLADVRFVTSAPKKRWLLRSTLNGLPKVPSQAGDSQFPLGQLAMQRPERGGGEKIHVLPSAHRAFAGAAAPIADARAGLKV